jgi:peptide deformylase
MSVLPILRWPDPRLAETCAPVGPVTDAVRSQAADMLETMYAAPGRGLAAPQVGILNRLFVMDAGWKDEQPDPQVMIDPEILEAGEETVERDEACLSIPGITTRVSRPGRVHLAWTALDGARMSQVLTGIHAGIAQHELDHLNGIVTLDRLDSDARARAEAEYGL